MKKLVFLPLFFAAFILVSHTKEDIKEKDMSFTTFLKLFPKENLPYQLSLKQLLKNSKKNPEVYQDSTESANINSIFAKYLPNSNQGNGIGNRGYFVNKPVAQIATNDYYFIFYSRNYMGYSFRSNYYMSVLDKKGQHIMTKWVASPGFDGYLETAIDKKLIIITKAYESLDDRKKKFVLKNTTKTDLIDLIHKTQQTQASK